MSTISPPRHQASQDSSDEDDLEYLNEDDYEIASFIRSFMEKKKNLSKHKESKRGGSKKAKKIILFKCKRLDHIQDECPNLKHKYKGAKERKKSIQGHL